jgi:hypothetical protein
MTVPTHDIFAGSPESVFERCSWFYAICRELLFTDHTDEIASTMTPLLNSLAARFCWKSGAGRDFILPNSQSAFLRLTLWASTRPRVSWHVPGEKWLVIA